MRSKASIKGHPIHPMLIGFPVAFFIGTFITDLVSFFTGNASLLSTSFYLNAAGVITALLAAIPGAIDYFGTVPPQSSAKKRATKHALINISNVLLFAIIWFYRQNPDSSPTIIIIGELAGCILLAIAGWMGATLVYRNQIGVDPRYAFAGKWKEENVKGENRVCVGTTDELKRDQMKLVHLDGKRIVIAHTENGYVAFDDRCSHKGGSLAGGALIKCTVQCPWHGSQFDVQTGNVKAGPASAPIKTYTVQAENAQLFLLL